MRQLHKMSLVPRPQSVDIQPCTKCSVAAMPDKESGSDGVGAPNLVSDVGFEGYESLGKHSVRDGFGSQAKELAASAPEGAPSLYIIGLMLRR